MEETLTLMEKTAILKSAELFAHMPTEALAELASRSRELHFEAGRTVFKEGDANRGAFLIVEGRVEIYKGRALDDIRIVGQGFGELALGEGEPHHFTAAAAEHTHVLNISNETLFDAILDFPEMGVAMVRTASARLTQLAQRVHDLEGQIAHLNATLQRAGVEAPTYQSGAYPRPSFK
ncbi:MAG TPA: cyclic nucleotide-binding domain-containing protein [Candidatus Limnocylindria bacterium]|nr:cyclic nucleotide-binding domain-containing protein [Candidatus Limnocylindria bacterium]